MKDSFDLDLNIEQKGEVESYKLINTLSKLCTITAIGCQNTGRLSTCMGTTKCNTKSECIV